MSAFFSLNSFLIQFEKGIIYLETLLGVNSQYDGLDLMDLKAEMGLCKCFANAIICMMLLFVQLRHFISLCVPQMRLDIWFDSIK